MKKTLLILLIFPLLMGAGCNNQKTNQDNDSNTNQAIEESNTEDTNTQMAKDDKMENDSDAMMAKTDVSYNLYENKAMGYTINIPDKWYWQHFMKNEISAAGGSDMTDDYLVADKNALLGLGSEYLGQIVVEKSHMSLADFAKDMNSYSKTQTTVAGVSATKFVKESDGQKMIQYHLEKDGQTYRIMYTSSDLAENEATFEAMVKSFSFVE